MKCYDFVIIEDDLYSEINYIDEVFCLLIVYVKDIGNEENVVYILIFFKIFVLGICVGWVLVLEWLKCVVVNLK